MVSASQAGARCRLRQQFKSQPKQFRRNRRIIPDLPWKPSLRNITQSHVYGKSMPAKHVSRVGEDIHSIEEVWELTPRALTLCLHNNLLHSLEPLAAFTNLVDLNVSLNRISSIQGISGLTKLTSLNLSSNLLQHCGGLSPLCRLKALQLQHNHITSISALCDLRDHVTTLAHLDLRDNKFNALLELQSIRKLSDLPTLLLDQGKAEEEPLSHQSSHVSLKNRLYCT